MKKFNLKNMIGGWFIGHFTPSVIKTNNFEVGIKKYKKGDREDAHYHKISTEYTIIVSGRVQMGGEVFEQDDIIEILPGEKVDFLALSDTITTVIKLPSIPNDKYN